MKRLAQQLAGIALAMGAGAAFAQASPGAPLSAPCGTTTNQQALGSSTMGGNVPGPSTSSAPSIGSVAGTNSVGTTDGTTSSAMAGPATPGSTSSTTPSTGTTAMGGPPASTTGSASTLGSSSSGTAIAQGSTTNDAATSAANTMGCR